MNVVEKEQNYIMQTYKRLPIKISKAKGCYIYDEKGNEYTDFLAGIAVNALGHSHPEIIKAVCEQAERYMHVSNYFYQEPQTDLAQLLISRTEYSKVFFTNSGTEAMEGALKICRRWGNSNSKYEVISFSGGFHGRTYGALSIMDKPHYKDNMEPFLPNVRILEYNSKESLEKYVNSNTAAVVLEFLQGEGGITMASEGFIQKLFELKNKYGFLIVADEIQSGAGRTGKFFCFDHYNVKPDVITMAKGMGGGLPLGAILVTEDLADIFQIGMHGTTYGGNALSCASGKVVVDKMTGEFLSNIENMGNLLKDSLHKIKEQFPEYIKEIRGIGLMQGLLLSFDASILVNKLLEKKVITNAASGNVLRLVPPLIITKKEVVILHNALDLSLRELIDNKIAN